MLTPIRPDTLGSRLRAARGALGLTQQGASVKAGLDSSYYAHLERGTKPVSLDQARKVAMAFGADPAVFDGLPCPCCRRPLLTEATK